MESAVTWGECMASKTVFGLMLDQVPLRHGLTWQRQGLRDAELDEGETILRPLEPMRGQLLCVTSTGNLKHECFGPRQGRPGPAGSRLTIAETAACDCLTSTKARW